jgi:hypothetical protein
MWLAAAVCLSVLTVVSTGILMRGQKVLAAQGDMAPGFALKDLNMKVRRSSEFKGKVIVINWFATW